MARDDAAAAFDRPRRGATTALSTAVAAAAADGGRGGGAAAASASAGLGSSHDHEASAVQACNGAATSDAKKSIGDMVCNGAAMSGAATAGGGAATSDDGWGGLDNAGSLDGADSGDDGLGATGLSGASGPGGADELRRRTKKKSKGGRIASEITREELSECFNMPSEDAAKKLGVGLTVLKRICRKFGVPRWPFRKLKSLDRLITNVESGNPPGDTYKHLMKSAEEIREHQKAMCTGDVLELDDKTKKLQQAYSKFNHKLRKAAKDGTELDESPPPGFPGAGGNLAAAAAAAVAAAAAHGAATAAAGASAEGQGTSTGGRSDAAGAPGSTADGHSMYMVPGVPFPMQMMMMDPSYQQAMAAAGADAPDTKPARTAPPAAAEPSPPPAAPSPALPPAAEPEPAALEAHNEEHVEIKAEDAAAAAWSHYAASNPHGEAMAAYWKQWAAAAGGGHGHGGHGEDPNAASAAAMASYYANPMAAQYMAQMAAAAASQASGSSADPYAAYAAYMPGMAQYMSMAGYDPSAMQQYYAQWARASSGSGATAAPDAQSGRETGGQDIAAAHAAYYAQFAPHWAAHMQHVAAAAAASPAASSPVPAGAASEAAPRAQQVHHATRPHDAAEGRSVVEHEEAGGKRKRKPNIKYEHDYATQGPQEAEAKEHSARLPHVASGSPHAVGDSNAHAATGHSPHAMPHGMPHSMPHMAHMQHSMQHGMMPMQMMMQHPMMAMHAAAAAGWSGSFPGMGGQHSGTADDKDGAQAAAPYGYPMMMMPHGGTWPPSTYTAAS